jgi:hypothetical protein
MTYIQKDTTQNGVFCLACMNVQLQSRPCRYVSTVHIGKVQFTQNQNLTLELGLWFMSVHMLLSLVNLHLEPPHNLKHCKGKLLQHMDAPRTWYQTAPFSYQFPLILSSKYAEKAYIQ